jgi:hypothetical protein
MRKVHPFNNSCFALSVDCRFGMMCLQGLTRLASCQLSQWNQVASRRKPRLNTIRATETVSNAEQPCLGGVMSQSCFAAPSFINFLTRKIYMKGLASARETRIFVHSISIFQS